MFKWLHNFSHPKTAAPAAALNFDELMALVDRLTDAGDAKGALDALRLQERHFGERVEFLVRQGVLLYSVGQFTEATGVLEAALLRDPVHPMALKFLVGASFGAGDFREGLVIGNRAIAAGVADADVHNAMGAMHLQLGALHEAIESFQTAVKLNPADTQALANLEAVKGRFSAIGASETDTEEIGRIRDGWIDTFSRKLAAGALTVAEGERFSQTIGIRHATWPLALKLVDAFYGRPDVSAVLAVNLSTICVHAGDTRRALELSELAFRLNPTQIEMRGGLGARLVREGGTRWTEGWQLLAETNRQFNPNNYADTVPSWNGEDLGGKKLFVHFDQGVGDALMALRFIPMLVARQISVVLWVLPAMDSLVAALAPFAQLVHSPYMPDPRALGCHYSCGLFDLAAGLGLTPSAISDFPLIAAPPGPGWREAVPHGQKGGIALALIAFGNPKRADDWLRSIPLAALAPLKNVPGIKWVNLSTDPRPEQSELVREFNMEDPTPGIKNFGDTASLLASVDGVISIDCSSAHLAAALGKPLWVLKPTLDDWRWQIGDTLSPWWPAARTFPAEAPGVWDQAIDRLACDLARQLPLLA
jgi:tetratricopeptide (TPR) repeat protein